VIILRVAIVGAGAGGSFTALLLARAGHDVLLLDQHPLELAVDPESAASAAYRTTAPQIVQPHMVMAKCRRLLLDRLPDVYDALLAAGAVEASLSTQMPASLHDRSSQSGDELLTLVASRRSTIDWVLLRALLSEPNVTVRGGVSVLGLLANSGEVPRVVGLRTNVAEVAVDVVVDATGRRSPIDRWIEEIGSRPSARWAAECGLAYFSRHYRIRSGIELPGSPLTRVVKGLDEFTVGMWGGDDGTMQLAVAPLATDRRFRRLKDPDVFNEVVRAVAPFSSWLAALDPITPVFHMAGLHNTLRRLVVDGAPVVEGLHAVADSVCTTNPTLARGLSLALTTAADLTDTLAHHPDDAVTQAVEMDRWVAEHVVPYYEDQAAIDAERLTVLRHNVLGAPMPRPVEPAPDRVTYAQLRTAALTDPIAFRGFWRVQGMTSTPVAVYTDPDVVSRTHTALQDATRDSLDANLQLAQRCAATT
jgi:2-polyprenyl-6-methoxyphenol hydroxylase-like FAD-dependent oxidoreductase